MIKILRAPEYNILPLFDDVVIFLAGPIQGSTDWHEKLIEKIKTKLEEKNIDKNVIICSPKRLDKDDNFIYDEQVNWESFYLDKASKQGIIVFWLAKEKEEVKGRSYAQTTRFEIGEWWGKGQDIKDFKILIGADEDFHGLRYITKKFSDSYSDFKLYFNMDDLVNQIIKKIVN